jgi:hypothetical protein
MRRAGPRPTRMRSSHELVPERVEGSGGLTRSRTGVSAQERHDDAPVEACGKRLGKARVTSLAFSKARWAAFCAVHGAGSFHRRRGRLGILKSERAESMGTHGKAGSAPTVSLRWHSGLKPDSTSSQFPGSSCQKTAITCPAGAPVSSRCAPGSRR